jgi:tetratricopeptide (TPR) repeat protein
MSGKELKTINDLRELSRQADKLAASGNKKECCKLLEEGKATAQNIDQAYELFFESELFNYQEEYEQAIASLEKALDLSSEDYFLLKSLGVNYSQMGDPKKAIELYDKAIEINPEDSNSWREKGTSYDRLDDPKKAIECYDKAIGINPEDFNAWRNKGVSYAKMGDQEKAIECYDKAIEINPKDSNACREKGVGYFGLGKHEEAIQSLEEACVLDPNNESFASDLAFIKTLSEHTDEDSPTESEDSSQPCEITSEDKNAGRLKAFVKMTRKKFESDIEGFKLDMKETEDLIKDHINATSPIEKNKSLFFVLRKWNSYTPILSGIDGEDSVGGGYFLYHNGEGVVVDPGYNFIENFHRAGLRIADIKHIVITHAHNDHTVDFESLLSLFYQFNRDKNHKHKIHIYLNTSSMAKLDSLIEFKSEQQIIHPISKDQKYEIADGLSMNVLPAYHSDTIADGYAIGIHFQIESKEGERNIVLTSDTSLLPRDESKTNCVDPDADEIWQLYGLNNKRPDLLIPHIGSVRPEEFDVDLETQFKELFYPNHLGVMGTLRVITSLRPELAVVSEFGEELKAFRPKLMELLADVTAEHCKRNKCTKINVVPGDLPFVYDIEHKQVYCVLTKDFVPSSEITSKEVRLKEGDETFTYFDRNLRESKSSLRLRRETEKFMRRRRAQNTCYFKEQISKPEGD